ncbi:hypothetical protein K6025_02010 [Ehrlichia sp. JZT12]
MELNITSTVAKLKWVSVITLALLLVFAGAFSWLSKRHDEKSQQVSDMIYDALINEVSDDSVVKILNDVANIKGCNYQYLAKFKLASIYSQDQVDKAQAIYADLASDKNLIPELRELAEYLQVVMLLKGDDMNLLESKIQELLSRRLDVYKSSIKELIAVSMIKNGDINSAIGIIKEIVSASDSEPTVYKNAIDLLQIYEN